MPFAPPFVLRATLMQTPARGVVEIREDALVAVAADGAVARVVATAEDDHGAVLAAARADGRLIEAGPGRVLMPGFVDLHVHAPQFPQLGTALEVPLETWLARHTFPLEARYADLGFADRAYRGLVDTLLANGTTTALYFATIHREATERLAEICLEKGQRALVGRTAMDDPALCPPDYRDASAAQAIEETEAFVGFLAGHPENGAGRVLPVVTPRFIPACTDALLEGLGEVARRCRCHVQTHASESDWEHQYVLGRTGRTDTLALDGFGLLGRRTVLAHGVFIDDADMAAIGAAGAGIAHCPLSNVYFSDAVFPLRAALDKGLHVGLGTDIAGGPDASMLANVRWAVAAARMLEQGVEPRKPRAERGRPGARIGFAEAFWMATAGGGVALDLPIGVIAPGYRFDAILVDPAAPEGGVSLFPDLDGPEAVFQKIVYGATRANIRRVFVDGRTVVDKETAVGNR